ncbi:MAG: UDP-N-acetylmuramoyl-tripeptide--D-alanyl-D-alanine ligase [Janthinobacterium lividum]
MSLWTADAMCAATGGVMTAPFHADGVSIDTRTLRPGDLFVALLGANGDGHAHVAAALAAGAAGCMVASAEGAPDGARLLVVGDTLEALQALGAAGRERCTGSVVAVTGSVGKTTTKEMLRAVLGASGSVHAAHASYNNHWGVPLTLARLPEDSEYCVVEIGMNHPGEIAPLSRLAGPDVAVITRIAAAHVGHLGSLEAIADEKLSVLEGVLAGGAAVLPADGAQASRLREAARRFEPGVRVVTFGGAGGDAALLSCEGDADGSAVTARIGETVLGFRVGAPGRHMAENALAALLAARAVGADVEAGAAALAGFGAGAGRGARRPILGGAASLLDESYNASGASVRAALEVLALQPAARRVAVLGDMLELGDATRAEHEGLAEAVLASADVVHCCGPAMRHLFDALPAGRQGAWAPDAAALCDVVAQSVRPGDAVLVKGSLGSRMRLVVAALDALGAPVGEDAA